MRKSLQALQIAIIIFTIGLLVGYDRGYEIGFSGIATDITEGEEYLRDYPLPDDFEIPPPDYSLDDPITDKEFNKLLEDFLGEPSVPVAPKEKEEPKFFIEDFINQNELIEANMSKEAKCLAQNIYFEARDQQVSGRLAVAMVSIYRAQSSRYPNTICKVVWQQNKNKRGKKVAQFSWTLDGKKDIPQEPIAWKKAQVMAIWVLAYKDTLIQYNYLNGATHYHATYVNPKWNWKKLDLVTQIDDHKFYRMTVAKK